MTNIETSSQNMQPGNDRKKIIILFLSIALVATWAYLLWNGSKTTTEIKVLQTQGVQLGSQRDSVISLYNESLLKIDSISEVSSDLATEKATLLKNIDSKKAEIRKILNDKNATRAELTKANSLIAELNSEIAVFVAEIARLKEANQQLASANTTLSEEKKDLETNLSSTKAEKKVLEATVDIASTFSASNIEIAAVNERKSGKERSTSSAKRTDKLVVSFDIENRIANSGTADIYILVTAPDGKTIAGSAFGSGTLATRNDGTKTYTSKLGINYEKGTRKNIQLPLYLGDFEKGNYKIQVYHNGFKIGEGNSLLK